MNTIITATTNDNSITSIGKQILKIAGVEKDTTKYKAALNTLVRKTRPAIISMWKSKDGQYECPICNEANNLPTQYCPNCGTEHTGTFNTDDRANMVIVGEKIPDLELGCTDLWRTNKNFSTVSIRGGIKRIGKYAFAECEIDIITISESVVEIGFDAFYKAAVREVFCGADPNVLLWNCTKDDFGGGVAPIFHVKAEHYAAYCEKFIGANVIFKGDCE